MSLEIFLGQNEVILLRNPSWPMKQRQRSDLFRCLAGRVEMSVRQAWLGQCRPKYLAHQASRR